MKFQASLKWRRNGANIALFAMLALWISPAFAWVCCCHEAAPAKAMAAHACCEKVPPTSHLSAPDDCNCDPQQIVVTARPESVDNFVFAPAILASASVFTFEEKGRDASAYLSVQDAKPPAPDPFASRGRAPPVFLAS